MPNPDPRPARLVVWRHPCECATASRPLEPGEEAEHRFDVDGEPFPWHITEDGARFSKRGELYLVDLDVIPLARGGNGEILDVTLSWWRRQPRIGERPFPWSIAAGSVRVDMLDDSLPVLHLAMLAEAVDADLPIVEDDESVRCPACRDLFKAENGHVPVHYLDEGRCAGSELAYA